MKTLTTMAVASVLVLAPVGWAQAQSGPGTAGAGNAAATSSSVGGGTPTQSGTAAGSTNPGNINVPVPEAAAPPLASPNQVPSGGTVQSTRPPGNQGPAATGSGTVGQSGRAARLQDPKEDPIVQQSEHEVSRRIKSICKGC
jgi:hypothetical protein